jgi:hypothetical protein
MVGNLTVLASPLGWRVAVALGTALVLIAELIAPTTLPVIGEPLSTAPPPRSVGSDKPTPAADYAAIGQHPLFHTSREPWSPPANEPPNPAAAVAPPMRAAPQPPQGYRLAGIVISDGVRSALLQSANGTTVRLKVGSVLDGWTVREINRNGLRFQADSAVYEVSFTKHP